MATSARRQREMQQREELILDIARQMLLESGYLGLNMDRIAEATEYSKGTVYQHFSCKEEILIALCIQNIHKEVELFERGAAFQGRTRERMTAIGEAFELFVRLYPHHFQSAQIIFNTSIRDKTSEARQVELRTSGNRLTATITGVIRDAIAQGDLVLPAWSSPEKLTFGLWSMAFGAYMLIAGDKPHEALGIEEPREALFGNYNVLLDGVGWQPLSHVWDDARPAHVFATRSFPMSTVSSNRAKIFFGPTLTKRRFLPKSPLRLALLVFGTVLIVLVILVMMGWQSALLVGATLPLSSLMVLSGMRLFGIPIQQMWVTGLTLTTHENKAVS